MMSTVHVITVLYSIAILSMGSYTSGFSPSPSLRPLRLSSLRMDPLLFGVDPSDVVSYHQSIAISSISTVLASQGGEWSFLWFHGGAPAASLAPLNSDGVAAVASMKDYFLPTSSDEIMNKALEGAAQMQRKGNVINSADFIQLNQVMPGAKVPPPTMPVTTYPYTDEISKREIEWYARSADLLTRRLPTAITVYALLDFFVLPNQPDFFSDELEDDRMGVARDWFAGAIVRFGALLGVVFLTIFCENAFYHPI